MYSHIKAKKIFLISLFIFVMVNNFSLLANNKHSFKVFIVDDGPDPPPEGPPPAPINNCVEVLVVCGIAYSFHKLKNNIK